MTYNKTKETALDTINELFLIELQKNFPMEMFNKYKETLLKMVNKELTPICLDIMKKNEVKLEKKYKQIQELQEKTEEEKQVLFNEELNSLFNFFGKVKMMQKAIVVQKNGINYIKFSEGQFSTKLKKKQKEEKIFNNLKKEYKL
jgi:hypothetical protein